LYQEIAALGLYPGWGNTRDKVIERLGQFRKVLTEQDAEALMALLPTLPLATSVVLTSVHGYFAQANVLGKPDTGGQVVYVLQQARALGRYMQQKLADAGVEGAQPRVVILTRLIPHSEGTTTHLPLEQVADSQYAWIMRVPFRDEQGQVIKGWVSRFQVWPYLRKFTTEAQNAIAEYLQSQGLGSAPDLILGHYADGNLVALWLGEAFGCLQGFVPHAFEKTKYEGILSGQEAISKYNFHIQWLVESAYLALSHFGQFNSYLEIAGQGAQASQIQPYRDFEFPGMYRVGGNVTPDNVKLNVNSPGVDTDIFFPYDTRGMHQDEVTASLRHALFSAEEELLVRFDDVTIPVKALGRLAYPDRPIILSVARPDKVKNLEGLVAAYATSLELRQNANLVVVTGDLAEEPKDAEEAEVMSNILRLIKDNDLLEQVRLLPSKVTAGKLLVMGELYRIVAEGRGIFVQPALYEGFGLTVIEAMACGLPVVASRNGGPSEIISHGENGLLIDPTRQGNIAEQALRLVRPGGERLWQKLSLAGIKRVRSTYNWQRHVHCLLTEFYLAYSVLLALSPEYRVQRRAALDNLTTALDWLASQEPDR
jgi:sucrose synthase